MNGHKALRDDVLMQTAVGRDEALASAPPFSRLENRATRAQAWALHGVPIEQFIANHTAATEELVRDIDTSDVPLHGAKKLSQCHAYYDHHCHLLLYLFCGQAMLACYLRPSKIDGAKYAAALIKYARPRDCAGSMIRGLARITCSICAQQGRPTLRSIRRCASPPARQSHRSRR